MTALPQIPSLYPGPRQRAVTKLIRPRTNFRLARAVDDGCSIESVVEMLTQASEPGRIRAIVRAARVCEGPTPMAYYDSWWGWL